MIILQVKGLSKSYGARSIFSGISFTLQEGEKVGLIGPNGTGKSTLLRCLAGAESPDEGEVIVGGETSLGFLAQQNCWTENQALFEELLLGFAEIVQDRENLSMMEKLMARSEGKELEELMARYARVTERYERAGGYGCEAMVKRVAKGLGFKDEELSQPLDTMSGGEKTRAALAKVLLKQPDILLLDEPTNHLDIGAVEWLEEFIAQYPKTVFIVSHDRYFLDQTVRRIMELEHGKLTSYQENYQGYLKRKGEFAENYRRAYEKQQQAVAKTEAFIRRYQAGVKSKQARGRQTILNRLPRLEKPSRTEAMRPPICAPVPESGFQVLEVVGLRKSFGARTVLSEVNLEITRGEKVALVGSNGSGKSTILKAVMGEILPDAGTIKCGLRVKKGYFSQEQETLDGNRPVLREIMETFDKGEEESRRLLAAFLFRGDEVNKIIADLSGGEKARVALLKLLLQGANFLVLDEPTNHLDIPSKEVFEDYLSDFFGTILLVSHDRYFLDKIVDRILELDEGKITDYPGNYSYYRYKRKESSGREPAEKAGPKEAGSFRNPAREQERILKQIARRVEMTEARLEDLEREKEALERRMSDPASYSGDLDIKMLVAEYRRVEEEINRVYAEWEALIQEQEEC